MLKQLQLLILQQILKVSRNYCVSSSVLSGFRVHGMVIISSDEKQQKNVAGCSINHKHASAKSNPQLQNP